MSEETIAHAAGNSVGLNWERPTHSGEELLFDAFWVAVQRHSYGRLPSDFGFPLAVHPHETSTIYVIPLKGAEFRCPSGGKLAVFRSRDGGASWDARDRGLPERSYSKVLREGMTTDRSDPAGIYFGTDTGKVFGSLDGGDEWFLVADDMPPVFTVSTYSH